jgi:hypothetical protein
MYLVSSQISIGSAFMEMILCTGSTTCFWRDPDAKFCIICGDDQEVHLELKCPYNYLSPVTYVPCRARLALWGNYTTTLRYNYKCPRHREEEMREPPMHDERNSRHLEFMRCLVRVNNLPRRYHPEQFAALFSRFGQLRMWHIATRGSGACKGYACVVFQHREHAEEAIEALNCCEVGERKLRVDWAYPLSKLLLSQDYSVF